MTGIQESLIARHRFIFRNLSNGMWHCINQDYAGTPADLCEEFGIAVPDSCQFLRCILSWDNVGLEFRAYGGEIRIDLYYRR